MHTQVAGPIDRTTRLALIPIHMNQREGKLLFALFDELRHAPAIDQVLEASLLAVGPVAVLGKDPHHRSSDGDELVRGATAVRSPWQTAGGQ